MTVFLEFFEPYSIFFHEIWHTDAKWQCLKCDRARFSKNIFFRPKMPEICRKNRFCAFSRDFIISFLFFCTNRHTQIFFISNSNFRVRPGVAKHSGSISEKFALATPKIIRYLCLLGQGLLFAMVRLFKKLLLHEIVKKYRQI